jgi:hypothetical protein
MVGRKRKSGPRERNGRIKREFVYDKGCEGVIRRQLLYGGKAPEQTFDAPGRLWCADLISEQQRDACRNVYRLFRKFYGPDTGMMTPDSLARYQPGGGGESDPDRDKIQFDVLNDTRSMIVAVGRDELLAFDEVVIDANPDAGPWWADHIILCLNHSITPSEKAGYKLLLFRRALDAFCD